MSEPLQHLPIQGMTDYEAALDTLLGEANRNLRIFEHSLGTSYNRVKRYDTLRNFLLADRLNRVYIVAHHTDNIVRDCPRLVMLLKQFSHSLAIHETELHVKNISDPFLVVDERHYLRRFHYQDSRGMLALNDPNGAHQLLERFDAIWQASFPAVSAAVAGL